MIPTLIYQKSFVCHANQPNSSHGSHVGATDFSWALTTYCWYSVHYGLRRLLLLLPQYSFSTSHKAQLISCLHLIKVVFHCYVCTSVRDEWVWCTYLPACKGLIILIHIACSTHILGILTTDESHLSMSVNRLSSHHFPLLNGQMVPEHYYTYLPTNTTNASF